MSVKTVEMVRKIRDKHYKETNGISVRAQIQYIRKKADEPLQDLYVFRARTTGLHRCAEQSSYCQAGESPGIRERLATTSALNPAPEYW